MLVDGSFLGGFVEGMVMGVRMSDVRYRSHADIQRLHDHKGNPYA